MTGTGTRKKAEEQLYLCTLWQVSRTSQSEGLPPFRCTVAFTRVLVPADGCLIALLEPHPIFSFGN